MTGEEIRTVLEKGGSEAAQRRFDELYPDRADEWTVDPEGLAKLGSELMQGGDYESAQTVMEMMAKTMESSLASGIPLGMNPESAAAFQQGMESQTTNHPTEGGAATEPEPADVAAFDAGPARNDLSRFLGEYGLPGEGGAPRTLYVTLSCDDRLVAGPMWADVSPWFMKSESDNTFTYADAWTAVRLEFEAAPEGSGA